MEKKHKGGLMARLEHELMRQRDQHAMVKIQERLVWQSRRILRDFFCCRIWMDAEVNDLVWN
jgi:hypothetical protein